MFKLIREAFNHGGNMWSGYKELKNQNVRFGAHGGWSTEITYIEYCVQNFKALHEEMSKL
jgi:hypothetical protein